MLLISASVDWNWYYHLNIFLKSIINLCCIEKIIIYKSVFMILQVLREYGKSNPFLISYKGTDSITRAPLSWPNLALIISPSKNSIMLGVKVSTYEFETMWKYKHSVHNKKSFFFFFWLGIYRTLQETRIEYIHSFQMHMVNSPCRPTVGQF